LKYDLLGNRVWRQYYDNSGPTTTTRKYVVDITGKLPTILCEIDGSSLTKSYIYSNTSQILCQRDGGQSAPEYFYVTDRLGSVRQVVSIVDNEPAVVLSYTYSPFGQMLEQGKKTGFEYSFNSFLFTGQWFDSEFSQYYLVARMYDPVLMRFTARDPVKSRFSRPLSLHKYLYCENDPLNRIDPRGLLYDPPTLNNNMNATQQVIDAAVEFVRERGFPEGPIEAFSRQGPQGLEVAEFDYKFTDYTFQISDLYVMQGSEFTNWLTAYTTTYLYGARGMLGTIFGGHYHALRELGHLDEPASRYFIAGGVLMGDEARWREGIGPRMNSVSYVLAKIDLYYGIERMAATDLTSRAFDMELDIFTTFWNSGAPR